MVSGVLGRLVGEDRFLPTKRISVGGGQTVRYLLEAYCVDMGWRTPAPGSRLDPEEVNRRLACILGQARQKKLSYVSKQASVWLHTGENFADIRVELPVTIPEWFSAAKLFQACRRQK